MLRVACFVVFLVLWSVFGVVCFECCMFCVVFFFVCGVLCVV